MVTARQIILAKYFQGMPKLSDFKIIEEELPALKNGEFLAEAVYLSVDPYMRAYAHNRPLNSTMIGSQVAKIIETKNDAYPVGKYVVGYFGWKTRTLSSGESALTQGAGNAPAPYIIPNEIDLPLSYYLSVLGMPGSTAYFGFLEICKPKKGETVAISGAAGAVGTIVGQIAKIKGCKVIGITGSDEKGRNLLEKFDFDGFVNYKTDNLYEKLKEIAPQGIDCYFDNVAGEISTTVMKHMNKHGRISVCGSISSYNYDVKTPPKVKVVQPIILSKQLVMEGFQNYLFADRFSEVIQQNRKWIQQEKMKYFETVTEGFDNMPKAFIEMLEGKNFGKAVVKV